MILTIMKKNNIYNINNNTLLCQTQAHGSGRSRRAGMQIQAWVFSDQSNLSLTFLS